MLQKKSIISTFVILVVIITSYYIHELVSIAELIFYGYIVINVIIIIRQKMEILLNKEEVGEK